MKEFLYKKEAKSAEQVKLDTLIAVLESQFNIEVRDFMGVMRISKDGKEVATISIHENNNKNA